MKLMDLLKVLDKGLYVELYNARADRIIKAPVEELLINDIKVWDKYVLNITPVHSVRENYLEITLID